MKPLPILLFVTVLTTSAFAQTPTLMWSFDMKDASFGQTAAGDIDGDGKLELVFGCYRNDSSVYALNAEDGSLLWKYNTHPPGFEGCNDVAPLIADTDGDGTREVIVPSSCNPTTFCFDGTTGDVRWTARTRGSDSPPTFADIDGDGEPEILHGEFGGYVICLDAATGAREWEIEVDTNSWIQTAPTVLDADGDGELDFVAATWNRVEGDTNAIRMYRGHDQALLWRTPLADVSYHGTAVADLDGDGKPELAIGDYSGRLTVLNAENGSEAWSLPAPGTLPYVGAPVSIGDINGDGHCELIAVSRNHVFACSHDGALQWDYTLPGINTSATSFRGAVLADVDGDALPDAVFGTSDGILAALKGTDGSPLWSLDLAAMYGDVRYALDHAPVIADLDNDGDLDVFIAGGHAEYPEIQNGFGRAYAFSIGKGEGPPWTMFQQNIRRTASLCSEGTTGIDIPAQPALPDVQVYPMPSASVVTVEAAGLTHLQLFSMDGREITSVSADAEQQQLDLSTHPAGMYVLVVKTRTGVRTAVVVKR